MKSFGNIYDDTKKKLGRQLQEKEKDFLVWMYNRHRNDKQVGREVNVYEKVKRAKKLQY